MSTRWRIRLLNPMECSSPAGVPILSITTPYWLQSFCKNRIIFIRLNIWKWNNITGQYFGHFLWGTWYIFQHAKTKVTKMRLCKCNQRTFVGSKTTNEMWKQVHFIHSWQYCSLLCKTQLELNNRIQCYVNTIEISLCEIPIAGIPVIQMSSVSKIKSVISFVDSSRGRAGNPRD